VTDQRKKKGPKTLIEPTTGQTPKVEFDEDWREMRPAWRVSLLEMHTPFGWTAINETVAVQIRERLASYESMRWKEFVFGYRSHFIKVSDLSKEAREHLASIEQDDIDSVLSLGIDQMSRIVGILEHNVLKVLWWDPDHQVCPSTKPNT
jgi:hypothetical protein